MKKYLIAFIVIILTVVAIIAIKRQNEKGVDGIGKIAAKFRPPRLRIVYSKKINIKERAKVSSSADANKVLKEIWSNQIEVKEEMVVLLLNRANQVLGYHVLSSGGITGTVADLRLLFGVALQSLAVGIIVAHNHPSGNLSPSESDIILTRRIKDAGNMMNIILLDNLIVTKEGYFSFADEGVL